MKCNNDFSSQSDDTGGEKKEVDGVDATQLFTKSPTSYLDETQLFHKSDQNADVSNEDDDDVYNVATQAFNVLKYVIILKMALLQQILQQKTFQEFCSQYICGRYSRKTRNFR